MEIFLIIKIMQIVSRKIKTIRVTGYKSYNNAIIFFFLSLILEEVMKKYKKRNVTKIKRVIVEVRKR